jgi:hypothetical protein
MTYAKSMTRSGVTVALAVRSPSSTASTSTRRSRLLCEIVTGKCLSCSAYAGSACGGPGSMPWSGPYASRQAACTPSSYSVNGPWK